MNLTEDRQLFSGNFSNLRNYNTNGLVHFHGTSSHKFKTKILLHFDGLDTLKIKIVDRKLISTHVFNLDQLMLERGV